MTTATSEDELPAAVIDHAATPTQIYCRDCMHEALDSSNREELSVDQIGDVLICDGDDCGVNIATTVERDRDD